MTGLRISTAVADLCDSPGGARIRQKLLGIAVTALEASADWTRVRTADDGYDGWLPTAHLTETPKPTHRVAVFATHLYDAPDVKGMGPRLRPLSFGAQLRVIDERASFFETDAGFVPKRHLRPLDRPFRDPVTVAQLHFNVPYLWGGNSTAGIDCSGLVQAALHACDIACPGDSGPQRDALGHAVTGSAQRGDLIFWPGHVGLMVDDETMIHANAHQMACTYEPLATAKARIAAQGDGEVVAHKRLG